MQRPRLYAFHLPDPIPFEDYETLLALLSPGERERVQRYRLAEDRLRSLISRIALWYHLLATHALQPTDGPPTFRSGRHGKPYLTTKIVRPPRRGTTVIAAESDTEDHVESSETKIGFNVSHEGRWVLMGIMEKAVPSLVPSHTVQTGPGRSELAEIEIGVDVMVPPSDPKELMEALIPQMTLSERQALSIPLAPSQLRWSLSALWALKEGYTKAVGDGVGFGLDRIGVGFDTLPPRPSASVSDSAAATPISQTGRRMESNLPVHSVHVDGVDVSESGWSWSIGTVGQCGSMDQVGWAMYWPTSAQGREGVGEEGQQDSKQLDELQPGVIEWDDLVRVFDHVPSYHQRTKRQSSTGSHA